MDTRTLTLFLPVVFVLVLVVMTSPRDDIVPDDDDVYSDKLQTRGVKKICPQYM
jgi:hypothetical protein